MVWPLTGIAEISNSLRFEPSEVSIVRGCAFTIAPLLVSPALAFALTTPAAALVRHGQIFQEILERSELQSDVLPLVQNLPLHRVHIRVRRLRARGCHKIRCLGIY